VVDPGLGGLIERLADLAAERSTVMLLARTWIWRGRG
jgi:hypothetical protein